MNEYYRILYSKLSNANQAKLNEIIKRVSQGFEGQIKLNCQAGQIKSQYAIARDLPDRPDNDIKARLKGLQKVSYRHEKQIQIILDYLGIHLKERNEYPEYEVIEKQIVTSPIAGGVRYKPNEVLAITERQRGRIK